MVQTDRLLRVGEAAERLGLKEATVRRMIYDRAIPVVRPTGGRAVRIRASDLEAIMRRGYQPAVRK